MTVNNCVTPAKIDEQHWSIETANWHDYMPLSSLERACFRAEDIWPFWDLLAILTLPGMVRLKAISDGHMVGFIGGERQPARGLGWITTLAVLPAYRRLGIASALLATCENTLGMGTIRLSVRESNQAAIQLYLGAQYKIIDRWKRYYVGGEDALVFEKAR